MQIQEVALWIGIGLLVWKFVLKGKMPDIASIISNFMQKVKVSLDRPAPVEPVKGEVLELVVDDDSTATEKVVKKWAKARKEMKNANLAEATKSMDDMFPQLNAEKGE